MLFCIREAQTESAALPFLNFFLQTLLTSKEHKEYIGVSHKQKAVTFF